jgi:hypothetical protein
MQHQADVTAATEEAEGASEANGLLDSANNDTAIFPVGDMAQLVGRLAETTDSGDFRGVIQDVKGEGKAETIWSMDELEEKYHAARATATQLEQYIKEQEVLIQEKEAIVDSFAAASAQNFNDCNKKVFSVMLDGVSGFSDEDVGQAVAETKADCNKKLAEETVSAHLSNATEAEANTAVAESVHGADESAEAVAQSISDFVYHNGTHATTTTPLPPDQDPIMYDDQNTTNTTSGAMDVVSLIEVGSRSGELQRALRRTQQLQTLHNSLSQRHEKLAAKVHAKAKQLRAR